MCQQEAASARQKRNIYIHAILVESMGDHSRVCALC